MVAVTRIAVHRPEGVNAAVFLADLRVQRETARLEGLVPLWRHRTRSLVAMRRNAAELDWTCRSGSPDSRHWPRRHVNGERRCHGREHKSWAIPGTALKSSRLDSASESNRSSPR